MTSASGPGRVPDQVTGPKNPCRLILSTGVMGFTRAIAPSQEAWYCTGT
jgi:hypothetical protein